MELSAQLLALKQRFIVPDSAVADLIKPRQRKGIFDYFYCPYAPCCSQCRGIFRFREILSHLRRVHAQGSAKIKALVSAGLPRVPDRG